MLTLRGGAAVVALSVAGCGPTDLPNLPEAVVERPGSGQNGRTVVDTAQGTVRGLIEADVLAFLGIPYAAPPVGDLRWRDPQPATPWAGERDATQEASACVQSWDSSVGSEDCLYLNVFVPKGTPADAKLATMVHLHGGGNAAGWAYVDASTFTRHDVVVVTLNYRLNVFGFLAHPALTAEQGRSSNYGNLDQIAALRWVQENIAAFGGDPDNVTLFGFSAGSFDTTAIASSPLAVDLVDRAAIQGAVAWADTLEEAYPYGLMLTEGVGCDTAPDVAACLRATPVDALIAAKPDWFNDIVPLRDGYLLPDFPRNLYKTRKLDLIIGSDREEASVWYWFDDFIPKDLTEQGYYDLMGSEEWGYGPFTEEMIGLYPVSDYDSPFWTAMVVDTDWSYTCSSRRVALRVADSDKKVWRYLFTHPFDHESRGGFPLYELRAFHGVEEDHLWKTFHMDDPPWYHPSQRELQLSDEMASYWTNFAKTGDPNGAGLVPWPRYEAEHERILLLDTPVTSMERYHVPQCDAQERAIDYLVFGL